MTRRAEELEREIAETRARLGRTLDALADKLSVRGIAGELAGSARARPFVSFVEGALTASRRNPVPAMLVAAAAGLLLYEMRRGKTRRAASYQKIEEEAAAIPVLNTGQARLYDPDAPSLHPAQDVLGSLRDMNARI